MSLARHLHVFEWDMHLPLAAAAGVPTAALATLDAGEPSPADLQVDLALTRTVARELIAQHCLQTEQKSGRSGCFAISLFRRAAVRVRRVPLDAQQQRPWLRPARRAEGQP
jgi:hypothetical protein